MNTLIPARLAALCVAGGSLLPTGAASATAAPGDTIAPSVEGRQGVAVETVAKDYEAERAGLRAGDVILRWSRGEAEGAIESPFDLSGIETEQAPRGAVTLLGRRGPAEQSWVLGPSSWGIAVRPSLPESLLALYREGQEAAKAGNLTEAAARWRGSVVQAPGPHAAWLFAWLLGRSAELFVGAQQWKDVDELYRAAIEQGAGPDVAAQLLLAWARTFEQRSEWASAEKYYQLSIAESRRLEGGELAAATAIRGLGTVSRQRGDLATAEAYLRQALRIQEKLAPDSLEVARTANILGIVAWQRGDLATAEEYYRQALAIRRKLAPESLSVAATVNNLGLVARQRGESASAEKYYLQALQILQRLAPGSLDAAAPLDNLGVIAWERGDLAKAEEYYRQALGIQQAAAPGSLVVAYTCCLARKSLTDFSR